MNTSVVVGIKTQNRSYFSLLSTQCVDIMRQYMMGKFWNLRLLCVCMAVAMPMPICAGDALAEDILDPKSHPEDVIEDLMAMK